MADGLAAGALLSVLGGLAAGKGALPLPADRCADLMRGQSAVDLPAAAGYAIALSASEGSRKGKRAKGDLRLYVVPSGMRSDGGALYGTLSLPLEAVGAPLCDGAPALFSLDPSRPGVLVTRAADGTVTLYARATANAAPAGSETLEGCGVAFKVDRSSATGFSGRWGSAGQTFDGCGTFRAERTSN